MNFFGNSNKVIICFFIILSSWAQGTNQKSKSDPLKRFHSLREKMMKDREVFKKFFEDSAFFSEFEKEMEQMMKDLQNGGLERFFEENDFDQMFDNKKMRQFFDKFQSFRSSDDYHWEETPKERILILKVDFVKDAPVNIKIEKEKIVITGKVERKVTNYGPNGKAQGQSSSMVEFKRQLSVPQDTDYEKAKIENVAGKIRIRFPKKEVATTAIPPASKKSAPSQPTPNVNPTKTPQNPGRVPLQPGPGDITI